MAQTQNFVACSILHLGLLLTFLTSFLPSKKQFRGFLVENKFIFYTNKKRTVLQNDQIRMTNFE